jgi:magnesium chelatase family protein
LPLRLSRRQPARLLLHPAAAPALPHPPLRAAPLPHRFAYRSPRVPHRNLADPRDGEPSEKIRAGAEAARAIQGERLAPFDLHANARMAARHIRKFCPLDEAGQKLLEMVTDRLGLSARSYSRILKVARTIADLAGEERIRQQHLAEAIQYRGLDRRTT